jgi:hypothetical protein
LSSTPETAQESTSLLEEDETPAAQWWSEASRMVYRGPDRCLLWYDVCSQQLTLWDQRGSRVIRGNVLAIPVSDTLLYVEPIYLQAEAAAYPELRVVALMHGDRLSYAPTFDEALAGLYRPGRSARSDGAQLARELPDASMSQMVRRASEAFDGYLRSLAEKRFEDSARHLEQLSFAIEQLESLSSGEDGGEDAATDVESTAADS